MKTHRSICLVSFLLMSFFLPATVPEASPESPARVFLRHILTCLNRAEADIGRMTAAVEETAGRMAAGGEIYLTDDETSGGFASEGAYRAGGLRQAKLLPTDDRVGRGDVVLVGTLDLDPEAQTATADPTSPGARPPDRPFRLPRFEAGPPGGLRGRQRPSPRHRSGDAGERR